MIDSSNYLFIFLSKFLCFWLHTLKAVVHSITLFEIFILCRQFQIIIHMNWTIFDKINYYTFLVRKYIASCRHTGDKRIITRISRKIFEIENVFVVHQLICKSFNSMGLCSSITYARSWINIKKLSRLCLNIFTMDSSTGHSPLAIKHEPRNLIFYK